MRTQVESVRTDLNGVGRQVGTCPWARVWARVRRRLSARVRVRLMACMYAWPAHVHVTLLALSWTFHRARCQGRTAALWSSRDLNNM